MDIKIANPTPVDGDPMPFSARLGDMVMPEVTAYRWNQATVNAVLESAGFKNIRWIQPELSPAGAEQFGAETFASYLKQLHALLQPRRRRHCHVQQPRELSGKPLLDRRAARQPQPHRAAIRFNLNAKGNKRAA